MTLKDKVGVSAWTLIGGWFAALLCIGVATLVSTASPIYPIAIVGGVVFGSLVVFGLAWFFAVMVRDISGHHRKHQDILFVSERDRLIDRSNSSAVVPMIRIVPAPPITPEVSPLGSFNPGAQQAFSNGGNSHES